jgi:hypothetical protein
MTAEGGKQSAQSKSRKQCDVKELKRCFHIATDLAMCQGGFATPKGTAVMLRSSSASANGLGSPHTVRERPRFRSGEDFSTRLPLWTMLHSAV